MATNDGVTVQAVETTLHILEALTELDDAGVTEIASTVDAPKSTVYNHLNTLWQNEYVVKEDDVYYMGLRFLKLGEHSRSRLDVFETARTEVDELATETGEVANLATMEFDHGVYLYRSRGDRAVSLATYAGMDFHLHCTALGKAILASLPREEVRSIIETGGLPAETEQTITDPEDLYEELQTVREQGYSTDKEEITPGLRCVAAPITDGEGTVLGSISVAGPTNRMRGTRFEDELPTLLMNAANVIELNVKYS